MNVNNSDLDEIVKRASNHRCGYRMPCEEADIVAEQTHDVVEMLIDVIRDLRERVAALENQKEQAR